MAKGTLAERIKAVLLYLEASKQPQEVCSLYDISLSTFRRWIRAYRNGGPKGLEPKRPGPAPGRNSIPRGVEDRILSLKHEHPSWGARRIKYQYDLPCHWRTVHRVIKRYGMLVRVKPKPQPYKLFQRRHVDGMWQGDTFQFRIRGVGKVYLTGFLDDRSRYRVESETYLHKGSKEAVDALRLALKKGRIPRGIYLDNAKQFISAEFREEARKCGIRLIFGWPYHPRGRGKIEGYHKALWRELITQIRFSSLAHFRRELRKFDRKYNRWRRLQALGWKTPASIYNDNKYFRGQRS